MKFSKIYIFVIALVFASFTIVFAIFPRSRYSELEKRELAVFPEFSLEKLKSGAYTKAVSSWFSDSEPFRDVFMMASMQVKDAQALVMSEDNIKFHASESGAGSGQNVIGSDMAPAFDEEEFVNGTTDNENAKIANAGIIIVGTGDKTRALMAFGGTAKGGTGYANAANKYKEVFGDKVNVYCMVIPTAVEYYCPPRARKVTTAQRPVINNIFAHLSDGVKPVDIYNVLGKHASEDIFLRTDHHWAPLGAYYAAGRFAQIAGVPFKDLSNYDRKVVHGYVGSMYGYSKDISIKNAPEDFVYYEPRGVKYTTTYINYAIDKNYRVVGEGKPFKSRFFFRYRDGNGGAYCTFMGGDTKITVVRTSVHNGRRLIILKDSFGNALPGFLFFSFEEIHVIDSRYFTKNMKKYVAENKITDILFANNIFKAYSSSIYRSYLRFLEQSDHSIFRAAADSTRTDTVRQRKESRHHVKDTTAVRRHKLAGDTHKQNTDSINAI